MAGRITSLQCGGPLIPNADIESVSSHRSRQDFTIRYTVFFCAQALSNDSESIPAMSVWFVWGEAIGSTAPEQHEHAPQRQKGLMPA